jgi:hypothetical protein
MTALEKQSYGRRLMPIVLDQLAIAVPDRLFAAVPKSGDLSDGFRDVSVSDVARCVDFMAHWIEDHFGRSETFDTLGYIGIPDLRGVITFYAAVKCGYKVSFHWSFYLNCIASYPVHEAPRTITPQPTCDQHILDAADELLHTSPHSRSCAVNQAASEFGPRAAQRIHAVL